MMEWESIATVAVVAFLFFYLTYALVNPEKF